ncbi:glycoside hydrolase family 79 protein [Mycena alexandri]|uniref:Glycoside hydrolase family 79 protein n=1 Tax=Mycena alexandri TaxID=1745969 RepID=A0AAD6X0W4_9AGAR|nr:glycoside hydrolase family 79 protein [Mycena alexandri]
MIPLLWFSLLPAAVAFSVTIPCSPADGAPFVSPSLVSLSIEQDRWPEWVGTSSKNQFFLNTLNNLKTITGAPPDIRIGANSEDKTNFSPEVKYNEDIFPAPTAVVPYPEALNITVGNAYYLVANHLPRGTHVTWGVNFGQFNITAAVLEATAIMNAFKSPPFQAAGVTLDFLEIGNEADLYANNGLRPAPFTSSEYVQQWTTFATNVSEAVNLSSTDTKFLIGSFAGSSSKTTGFSPQAIYAEGVLDSNPGKLIATFSEHHYSGSFCTGNGGLLQDLMTKATIRSNLTIYSTDVVATHAQKLDYILGETNSYACHGAPGVSNTAGAALWALDYALFAPQIGISKVFFHVVSTMVFEVEFPNFFQGIGFKYSLLQPVALNRSILDGSPLATPLPPHVQPLYYSAIIAAELRGCKDEAQISEITVNDTRIAGYAAFEAGELVRAVFINSQAFLQGSTNRTSIHLDLEFTGKGPSTMTVKRLAIGFADDTSGVTWGGQTYETTNGLVEGKLKLEYAPISKGLDIAETEVVLLDFSRGKGHEDTS